MATIRPLRGIRYNTDKIEDLASVIAPPYDVISADEQARLYNESDFNIVRLELGQEQPGDNDHENRYTRARGHLNDWLAQGVLSVEQTPALYVHWHEFPFRGQQLGRLGLIAALRLEDWSAGAVLPHENTLSKPKADRMKLLRACECNLSPVMILYEDPDVRQRLAAVMASRQPDVAATEADGQRHSLWVVTDADLIEWISSRLAPRPLFIADGHHRYETALQYRKDLAAIHGELPADHPANFVLATLFDFTDPGLVVLPTHRMLRGIDQTQLADLIRNLARSFDIQTRFIEPDRSADGVSDILAAMESARANAHAFGIIGPDSALLNLVTLPREHAIEMELVNRGSAAYRQLDVSVLHDYILSQLLNIDATKVDGEQHVAFTRDEMAAFAAVRDGQCQLAVFLNSTLPQEIRDVALAGDRMPQKSTYFYPKLPTGLVLNSLSTEVASQA